MKKFTLFTLLCCLVVTSCASVAKVDKYAAEKNINALNKLMTDEKKAGEIRRAATIKLGKFQEDSARAYLQAIIKGESLGRDTRSPQTKKEQQILAMKLLSQYGAGCVDQIIAALSAVEPVATRAELAIQVNTDLGQVYNDFLYKLAKDDNLPAEQAKMVLNFLAPKAEKDIRMCYFYYDVVSTLAKSSDSTKKEAAASVVNILPVCEANHFEQKDWLTNPHFLAAYEAAQSARVPMDNKLAQGETVTIEDAKPSIQELQNALKIDPANPLARYSMARLYQTVGDNEEALSWIKSVFPTAIDWGIAYGLLCDLEFKLGHVKAAGEACDVAVAKAPNVAWHHYLQGIIYKRRGTPESFQKAYNAFTYAVSIDAKTYGPILEKDLDYLARILEIDQQ